MRIVEILAVIGIIIFLLVSFVPFEWIYTRESKPTEFLPEERPKGLVEAYNSYIVISYGTLLKRNQEEFFAQLLRFDSSENARSYFLEVLDAWRNVGINFEVNPSDGQKVIVCESSKNREECSIALLKDDKLFYFRGNKAKIEKVIKWFVNRNS